MFSCLPQISWIPWPWPSLSQEHSNRSPNIAILSETNSQSGETTTLIPKSSTRYSSSAPVQKCAHMGTSSTSSYGSTKRMKFPGPSVRCPLLTPPSPDDFPCMADSEVESFRSSVDRSPSILPSPASSHSGSSGLVSISERLCDELREWPGGGNQWFLPDDAFRRLITLETIEEAIVGLGIEPPSGLSYKEAAQSILDRYMKLFAILALIGKIDDIHTFVEEDIHDGHLPFTKSGKKFLSIMYPDQQIRSVRHWTVGDRKCFAQDQWALFAPIFKWNGHYILDKNQILPFVVDSSSDSKNIHQGGFAAVYEVVIHPAHQLLGQESTYSKYNPSFAVKRLYSQNKSEFEREVEMLKWFRGDRHHSHLSELLATFEYRGNFFLIFPFAKCDLRSYWQQTTSPEFSHSTVGWLLQQSKGLASAVQRIHGFKDTIHAQTFHDISRDSIPPNSVPQEIDQPHFARHGDIKPENILWSDENPRDPLALIAQNGALILADFGQMRNYTTSTELRNRPSHYAESLSYAPPEARSYKTCAQTSRSYDIWSLGCVYLESIIWLLCGWDELCRFTQDRGEAFYAISKTSPSNDNIGEAILHTRVKNWIDDLYRMPKSSKFIHEFLDLISEMLVVDSGERIRCGLLNARLSAMVQAANTNQGYLIERRPSRAGQDTPLPPCPSVLRDMESMNRSRAKHLWNAAVTRNRAIHRWQKVGISFHKHAET